MSDSQPYNDTGLLSGTTTNNFIHDQHYADHQSSTAKAPAVSNSLMGLPLVPNGISPLPFRTLQSSDTTDLSQQQMQLQQVPLYLHQHQQRIQKSVDTSSNSSHVGQILEDGCYPEYKH
ncbi:uncharacterized protein Dana_GF13206, isoform C [Drosophila ananassae]|uniref:Uncharacterized protein, isoform C n=1 Tax=Drosophila ananassae TaxID=7217 RepID=A0A0P8XYT7_DROAN|nr:uncharacterized protein Dana_GF13206, isoform C [Drosophila ananassae]